MVLGELSPGEWSGVRERGSEWGWIERSSNERKVREERRRRV